MPRKSTPTFVVEIPLAVTPSDARRLDGVFEAGKRLYNVLLQEGLGLVDRMRADPAWAAALALPKKLDEERIARSDAFRAVRAAHGFSDFAFQSRATLHKNAAGFADRLGANVTQKAGTRAFKALEEWVYGLRGRPRFKGVQRPLHSLEGKNNAGAPRWDYSSSDNGFLVMARDWGIEAKALRLASDEWLWSALQAPTKYCRVLWRNVGNSRHYYCQLVQEGRAPMKASLLARLAGEGTTGALDIGPSTIGWVTETEAGLFKFCADVDEPRKLVRRLQRKVDRQRRANNPANFDEKGRARRGCTWKASTRQQATQAQLRAAQAHTAEKRANAHGRDINALLSRARSFRHDGVSVRSLQKNYGRSVGARAPGHFMSELKRKAERAGGGSSSVNVRQLKTSQYDHSTGAFVKKALSERWHVFGDGRGRVQRDVYSAFLARNARCVVDAEGIITWDYEPAAMQAAWVLLAPALLAQQLFYPQTQDSDAGASIALRTRQAKSSSSKAYSVRKKPGGAARGAART